MSSLEEKSGELREDVVVRSENCGVDETLGELKGDEGRRRETWRGGVGGG